MVFIIIFENSYNESACSVSRDRILDLAGFIGACDLPRSAWVPAGCYARATNGRLVLAQMAFIKGTLRVGSPDGSPRSINNTHRFRVLRRRLASVRPPRSCRAFCLRSSSQKRSTGISQVWVQIRRACQAASSQCACISCEYQRTESRFSGLSSGARGRLRRRLISGPTRRRVARFGRRTHTTRRHGCEPFHCGAIPRFAPRRLTGCRRKGNVWQ